MLIVIDLATTFAVAFYQLSADQCARVASLIEKKTLGRTEPTNEACP